VIVRFAILVLLIAADAEAGPSELGWLGATEVLPARAFEPQVRLTDRDDLGDTRIRETSLVAGAQIGITDRLELTLPFEASYLSAVGVEPALHLRRYGVELRYRFTERPSRVAPLLRLAVFDDVLRRDVTRTEIDAGLSYRRGRVFAGGELGVTADVTRGGLFLVVRPGAGVTYEVTAGLRLGGELHVELDRETGGTSWAVAGPSVAWRHGGFWLAATYGVGLSNIASAPRIVWGGSF
jgi:hypothetical protein